MTKRVNITFNTDNPMDSLIISLLGGEESLTSKGIKAKLLEMTLSGDAVDPKNDVRQIGDKIIVDVEESINKISKSEHDNLSYFNKLYDSIGSFCYK